MDELKVLFERQARWQRSRARLSWTEKLCMAEILREAALEMGPSQRKSEMMADNETKDLKKY